MSRRNDSESAHLEDLGHGKFAVRSDLTFETVTSVLEQSKRLFAPHERIDVDMSDVGQADSAGLALLLEWLSWARGLDREIQYRNIPRQILAVAEIGEVTDLLAGKNGKGG